MFKQLIRRNTSLYRYSRLAVTFFRLLDPNFLGIRRATRAHKQHSGGRPCIVLAGSVGLNPDMLVQTLLGVALKRSGAEVFQFSCDSAMKLCFNSKSFHYDAASALHQLVAKGQGKICDLCHAKSVKYSASAELKNEWLSLQLTDEDRLTYQQIEVLLRNVTCLENLRKFKFEGLHVGEHAYSATVRFFASPAFESEPYGVAILREYILSSTTAALGFQRFLDKQTVDLVVVDHGIYVPQGVITEIAKNRSIRVLTFNTGYRRSTFLFAEGDSYHFAIPRSKEFGIRKYTDTQREIAIEYVKGRAFGRSDWVHFQPQNVDRALNFDQGKLHVAVFPNVLWDADVHFEEGLFASSSDWLLNTIEHLCRNPNVIVHVRIHPGEIKGAVVSRYGVWDLLKDKKFADSTNLIVYYAEDDVNSYTLAEKCDFSIVYGSKIGIDLAALGHRVLTAGDCWTRNKSITTDPSTIHEYFKLLDAPSGIVPSGKRGIDFAYYLYFEKMYFFDFVSKRSGDPPFKFDPIGFDRALADKKSDINRLINEILG